MLWWAILQDVPTGLDRIECPVTLAQGALDVVGAGQTPRYLSLIPGSRFELLPADRSVAATGEQEEADHLGGRVRAGRVGVGASGAAPEPGVTATMDRPGLDEDRSAGVDVDGPGARVT